ncbi:MAG: tRNA uridine-5-carboxymethylaminomethyl(34) synthesis GTPase MnmE [Neisseriaceae bacterium]|nr:tRNA uridine-5-carboxymethylaminomethyl(34) synthesis GTPase MnmE [Neisseriaceae bacterium]
MTTTIQHDTIAAIATATGGGVGMIRLSGCLSLSIAKALTQSSQNITPRYAYYRDFYDENGEIIDSGLLLYFPNPASFTGEDVIELHAHGGAVVLQMLLSRCLALGARPAEAGEFSKRAFLNGKIDLTQAESIVDLIAATSTKAVRMATRSLKGVFSHQIHALVQDLIDLRMLIEASLDFPEEEIDFLQDTNALERLQDLQNRVRQVLDSAGQGVVLRDGLNVVLLGAPNVGKSSLLNALAGEEVAIVTDIAGTTRDTIREQIVMDGVPIHLVDTAGLRKTDDIVEQKGIERSREAVNHADIAFILTDGTGINSQTQELLDRLPENIHQIEVVNKIDLREENPRIVHDHIRDTVYISAKTGAGLNLLKKLVLRQAGWQGENDDLFLARTRHVHALRLAQEELFQAASCTEFLDLFAEHLRLAQNALNQITGEFTPDDLLGEIFSRFCIGK